MARSPREVLEEGSLNAVVSWFILLVLAGIAVESWLDPDLIWAGVTTTVLGLSLLPPVAFRDPRVMVPWEILCIGTLPVLGWAWDTVVFTTPPFMYLAVGTIALIITIELDAFTPVRMTDGFAVLMVVIATVAGAGLLAIGQWLSDMMLGTAFITTHDALMQGFVTATLTGAFAGLLYRFYFRRLAGRGGGPDA